jgi:hypothetical protein
MRRARTGRFLRRGSCWGLVAVSFLFLSAVAGAQVAPPNDNFANATVITGSRVTVSGTNVDATVEPGEPEHAGKPGGHSVWWSWAAPADGAVTIDTCDSDFDTLLAVYTGTTVNALTPVASNDDAEACGGGSSVTFVAASGQAYAIAVDGAYDETGEIALRLQPTMTLQATTLKRSGKIDATRFQIEVASEGEGDFPNAPQLVFMHSGRKKAVDLELENELQSETRFRYTFDWSCDRRGAWQWTVSESRDGVRVGQQGSFTVPACQVRAWFVSMSKVRADFARDFNRQAASWLRCRAVGQKRGQLAASWRCGLAQPGATCTGSFLFRYSQTLQAGDVVGKSRQASGRVTCRS